MKKQFLQTKNIERWRISIQNPFFLIKNSFQGLESARLDGYTTRLGDFFRCLFYEIGGGFEDINGLGINKIYEYAKRFGLERQNRN